MLCKFFGVPFNSLRFMRDFCSRFQALKHREHDVFLKGASFTSETLFAQTQRANMYGPTRGNTGRISAGTPFAFLTSGDQNSPRSLGSGSPRTPSVQAHTAPSFHFGAQNGNMKSPQYQNPVAPKRGVGYPPFPVGSLLESGWGTLQTFRGRLPSCRIMKIYGTHII